MKITAIGLIKNAADVIETCVRGNSWLIDQFVFLDNMSTDRTVEILESLKAEGFQIDILSDKELRYLQTSKTTKLAFYAQQKYPSDFIIPIDDDEIIIPSDSNWNLSDVKEMIDSLSHDAVYCAQWRVFLPTEYDNPEEINVAKRQKYCYSDNVCKIPKVIIPTEMLQIPDFEITQGNHRVISSNEIQRFLIPDLKFAHFPIRDSEQIRSKALIGWTNYLAIPKRERTYGTHWEKIYRQVRDGIPLTIDTLQTMSLLYVEADENLNIIKNPVQLPDEYMQIKYTYPQEINALKNYCHNVEELAAKYAELLLKQSS